LEAAAEHCPTPVLGKLMRAGLLWIAVGLSMYALRGRLQLKCLVETEGC
jgi:hypothetical protein